MHHKNDSNSIQLRSFFTSKGCVVTPQKKCKEGRKVRPLKRRGVRYIHPPGCRDHLKNAPSPSNRRRPLRGRLALTSLKLMTTSCGCERRLRAGPGRSAPHAHDHHQIRAPFRSASRKIKERRELALPCRSENTAPQDRQ